MIMAGSGKNGGYAGGVFFEISSEIIDKGGVAVGAAYAEDFSVEHMEAADISDLERLTGVKYAESCIGDGLKKGIIANLEKGREVLFSGTPCQVRAMYQYLGKGYGGLYTVAVGCSGVIRADVWRDYLAEVSISGSDIKEVHYPYRGCFGLSQQKALIAFRHGTAYFRDEKEDRLLKLKKAGLIYKEECYQCAGNFCGADVLLEIYGEEIRRETKKEDPIWEGRLTHALACTAKGEKLLRSVCPRMRFAREINAGVGGKEGKPTFSKKPVKPTNYRYFWKNHGKYGFSFAADLMDMLGNPHSGDSTLKRFLEKYTELDAKGISLETVLSSWGLGKVVLYKAGSTGGMLCEKLSRSGRLCAVINEGSFEDGIKDVSLWNPGKNPTLPILVPPAVFVPDIIDRFSGQKIAREKILPLSLMIDWEYDRNILGGPGHTLWDGENGGLKEIYLITGAQFGNKGAQSMLFTAVSEIRKKNKDCDIYFLPVDSVRNYPDVVSRMYRFHILRDRMELYGQFYDLIPQVKAIVDVSGYSLISYRDCRRFVQVLSIAKEYDIPIYLMPQSYGPLDFESEQEKRIRAGLAHARVVFAREKEGYDLLTKKWGLSNVRLSRDLVLQNKGIDSDLILTRQFNPGKFRIGTKNNIAVVPNIRNYELGNRSEILDIYKHIIAQLLKWNKNVYIVSHSDDQVACGDIYRMFEGEEHVFLYENKPDCLEYCVLCQEFQYMLASRYHAIVHAYKESIPCIVIGWAEKYHELLGWFRQDQYLFDVRRSLDMGKIMETVGTMEKNWIREKETIQKLLPMQQMENCFDVIA